MKRILFTCVGSTDPVRGLHDGPMLHIIRHYRPEQIVMYVTPEMANYDALDGRFRLTFEYLKRTYPDYAPSVERIYGDTVDVSEFDCFYQPFEKAVRELNEIYPEAEILLNLSSGTTQMKMTMALLAMDLRFPARGIQVKNFESRSGTSERSTSKTYDIEFEIEFNEDNEEGAANRCKEPRLFVVRRAQDKKTIKTLLDQYQYDALNQMRSAIPADCRKLVRHLAARASYQLEEAEALANNVPAPVNLYPGRKTKDRALCRAYREESEYLLCLKLMQKNKEYTNLVVRLNPLVLRLQQAYLKRNSNFDCEKVTGKSGRRAFVSREKIRAYDPKLEAHLDSCFDGFFRESDISIAFCNYVLQFLGKAETEEGRLFAALDQLNQNHRNTAAHNLNDITERDIRDATGMESKQLMMKLESLMGSIYPELYDAKLFRIYDTCNEYIYNRL